APQRPRPHASPSPDWPCSRVPGRNAVHALIATAGLSRRREFPDFPQAFRWTEGAGIIDFGFLPGSSFSSAEAVSAEGDIVAGTSFSDTGKRDEAFIWTASSGMIGLGESTWRPIR